MTENWPVAPLDVNPAELSAAGQELAGDGNGLVAALSALTAGLSGANPGQDPLGQEFARGYRRSGGGLLMAGAAAVSAAQRLAYGIKMSAYNYALANASSVPGGAQPSLLVPPCPAPVMPPAMPDASGHGVAAPALWAFVAAFVGYAWPDGDPASLRAGAQAWRTYGDALKRTAGELAGTRSAITGLPESDKMSTAINQLGLGMVDIAGQCHRIAEGLNSFARTVESTQNAIRDLLNRLNPMGLAGLAYSVFKDGDPFSAIKAVAHDIEVLLDHVRDEAAAAGRQFEQGLGVIDSAADGLERWISKEFPVVAPVVNGFIDIEVGVFHSAAATLQGIEALDPSRFVYDFEGALKSWKDTAATLNMANPAMLAAMVAHDFSTHDPHGVLERAQALTDAKDWNSDHPLRGLGHNIGDLAQLAIPGIGEAKTALTASEATARVGETSAGLESSLEGTARESASMAVPFSQFTGETGSSASKAAADLDRIPAPAGEPPRLQWKPEPPRQGAMPSERPTGLAPMEHPGLPIAGVKSTTAPHDLMTSNERAPLRGPGQAPPHEEPPGPSPHAPGGRTNGEAGDLPATADTHNEVRENDLGSSLDDVADAIPPLLVREEPYETGGIQEYYTGEQYPTGHFGPPGVNYLDEVAREAYRITTRDGLVFDSQGRLFDTENGISAFGPGSDGRAIFVMDEHGNLYASLTQARGVFHHSSFFGGKDVAAAGELVVRDGKVELVTDHSGHYAPDRLRTQQVLDQLASQGIVVDPNNVDYWAP